MLTLRALRRLGALLIIALLVAFSWRVAGTDLDITALSRLANIVASMFPPKLEPTFLKSLALPVLETIAIALAGMTGALLIAAPLTYFAIPPQMLRASDDEPPTMIERALHLGARAILAVLRTIPELIWALMFVRSIGLGTAPGVLAIALSYAGVLGKVFAEIIESTNKTALEPLRASGAGKIKVFLFGVVPQALPLMTSYSLYRFDCALRSSAVLGLVGAGGVGFQIELSTKMMEYGEVLTEVIVLFGLVAIADLISARVRAKFAMPPPSARFIAVAARETRTKRSRAWIAILAAYAALVIAASAWIGLTPQIAFEALSGFGEFFVRAFPPEPSFARYFKAAIETIAIAFLGTFIAIVLAFPLAVLGAKRALVSGDEFLGTRQKITWWIISTGSRLFLNILRTIPMVIFALIFVPAVGIGPFAGVLAMAFHTAGTFGRLFTEAFDEVRPSTLEIFRSLGAKKAQTLAFAVIPQTSSQLSSYFLYRWEVNIRESVILGIVGGGGIGQLIYVSMSLFHEHETYSLIITLFILVGAGELISSRLRRWLLEMRGERRDAKAIGAEAQLSA